MTVGELVAVLEQFDPELPVALADWSEGHYPPSIAVLSARTIGMERCVPLESPPGAQQDRVVVVLGGVDVLP